MDCLFPLVQFWLQDLFWGITTVMVDALRIWILDSAHDYSRGLTSREFWFSRAHRKPLNHLILEPNLSKHYIDHFMHKRYCSAGSLATNQNLFMYLLKMQIPELQIQVLMNQNIPGQRPDIFSNNQRRRLLLGITGRIESHEQREAWIPNFARVVIWIWVISLLRASPQGEHNASWKQLSNNMLSNNTKSLIILLGSYPKKMF